MSNSLPSIDLNVVERLKSDPEFRQQFFLAESSALIAQQLIRLRKRRGLNQEQLAAKLSTQQPAISRVESADYRNWSFNTLRRHADVLEARLRVYIEPYEDVIAEYETEDAEAAQGILTGSAADDAERRRGAQYSAKGIPAGSALKYEPGPSSRQLNDLSKGTGARHGIGVH